jgi:hypothetical protein
MNCPPDALVQGTKKNAVPKDGFFPRVLRVYMTTWVVLVRIHFF